MAEQLSMARHATPIGDIILGTWRGGFVLCLWAGETEEERRETERRVDIVRRRLCDRAGTEITLVTIAVPDSLMTEAGRQIDAYMSGVAHRFSLPLTYVGTQFQIRVWTSIASIPYGSTASYNELAILMGEPTSARAVANACGANPLCLLIPCHRVVRADGNRGGYSGGERRKAALLSLEAETRANLLGQ